MIPGNRPSYPGELCEISETIPRNFCRGIGLPGNWPCTWQCMVCLISKSTMLMLGYHWAVKICFFEIWHKHVPTYYCNGIIIVRWRLSKRVPFIVKPRYNGLKGFVDKIAITWVRCIENPGIKVLRQWGNGSPFYRGFVDLFFYSVTSDFGRC